jgi:hypothetical protein
MPQQNKIKPRFGVGVGVILLFFACLTLSVSGLLIITTPTPRPVSLGWIYLAVAIVLAVWTANFWRAVLPGIFACGALNGMYIASTGHTIGRDGKEVSQPLAWVMTVLLLAMAIIAAKTKAEYKMDVIDRVAYALFFVSFTVAFAIEHMLIGGLLGMLISIGFLLLRHRHERSDPQASI